MPTQQELLEYLREGSRQGATRLQMTEQLEAHGWSSADVSAAFAVLYTSTVKTTPITPTPTLYSTISQPPPVDVFPHGAQTFPVAVATPASLGGVAPTSFSPSSAPVASAVHSMAPHKNSTKTIMIIGIAALLLGLSVGTAYAFVNKIGVFARVPYTEDDIFSGLLARAADIKSATYSATGALSVEPRDKGALPFTLQVSNEAKLREQYQNDSTRVRNISMLLSGLQAQGAPYPASLTSIVNTYRADRIETTDPVSGEPYAYQVIEGGNNFTLMVTFEVPSNISLLKRYSALRVEATQELEETIKSDGMTITFTKNSSAYAYVPSEPPKPLLVSLGESMRMLPAEMNATLGITAASEWNAEKSDWKFNVGATGDFGDLSYKIDVDALKKGDLYYFRINNLPSLFLGSFASVKGEWVEIDPAAATSSTLGRYSSLSSLSSTIKSAEEQYKKARVESVAFMKKVVQFADEEKLVSFKTQPRSEKLDGRLLYRYEFSPRKEAIIPFFTKVIEEAGKSKEITYATLFKDQGLLEYLKSDEFTQMFDYVNENVTVTLWVDPLGYPARLEYSFRVVPPDTATQLEGKQVRLVWAASFSDINKSVDIKTPGKAMPLQELIDKTTANQYDYSSAASLKAKLAAVATNAELVYDKNGSSYSPQSFPLGPCAKTTGTLFGDSSIFTSLESAAGGVVSRATCTASASSYAVSIPLPGQVGYSFCIDSTGYRGQITGTITKSSCQ